MNASQFMDKQIMELSGSGTQSGGGGDFLELLNPPENRHSNGAGGKKEEILPSYDFQPIRAVGSSPPPATGLDGGRAWGSADSSKAGSSSFRARNYGSLEAHDSSKVIHEKSREAYDAATLTEFDRTVKKYADNLLHALEGVSSRLSQLEGRTHNLESAMDDLKLSIANTNGSTDGKLRQLENILREVLEPENASKKKKKRKNEQGTHLLSPPRALPLSLGPGEDKTRERKSRRSRHRRVHPWPPLRAADNRTRRRLLLRAEAARLPQPPSQPEATPLGEKAGAVPAARSSPPSVVPGRSVVVAVRRLLSPAALACRCRRARRRQKGGEEKRRQRESERETEEGWLIKPPPTADRRNAMGFNPMASSRNGMGLNPCR